MKDLIETIKSKRIKIAIKDLEEFYGDEIKETCEDDHYDILEDAVKEYLVERLDYSHIGGIREYTDNTDFEIKRKYVWVDVEYIERNRELTEDEWGKW